MERKPKTIFQLDSPFTDIQWPETSPRNQDTILELLCSLILPIGQYRATNSTPSKGKRSKKRKRKEDRSKAEEPDSPRPPLPEISSFVVVGLNSITRSLESLSQKSKALKSVDCQKNEASHDRQSRIETEKSDAGQVPHTASKAKNENLKITEERLNGGGQYIQPQVSRAQMKKRTVSQSSPTCATGAEKKAVSKIEKPAAHVTQSPISHKESEKSVDGQDSQPLASASQSKKAKGVKRLLVEYEHVDRHFSAIFVPRSSQPLILHAHLPQLVTTASLANPELPVTRLVQLPRGCETRLAEALGLPRVSFIGILDGAPHSKSLVDLVRNCVSAIEIPWLQEAKKSEYLPVKINAIESFAPVPAPKKEQKPA